VSAKAVEIAGLHDAVAALQAGALAERFGASFTLAIGGDICLLASCWLWLTRLSARRQGAEHATQTLAAK
jgi:hypothetical protein